MALKGARQSPCTTPLEILVPRSPEYESAVKWLERDLGITPIDAAVAFELYQGRSKKQVAAIINRSEATVADHANAVYQRLRHRGVVNVASLARLVSESLVARRLDATG